jgi:aspartyl protease family protein
MMDSEDYGRLSYLLLLLLAVSGWIFVEYKGRIGFALRSAAAWAMIFIGVAAGYGLWTDMQNRATPMQNITTGTVELPRAGDGHYYATLTINGTDVTFLADTGATEMVLSVADAERLGIDPTSLRYFGEAQTANGTVRMARVSLPVVGFGPFEDRDVEAFVNQGEMDGSLLGMAYLGRFEIAIANSKMILSRN